MEPLFCTYCGKETSDLYGDSLCVDCYDEYMDEYINEHEEAEE